MISPAVFDIAIPQGATFSQLFQLKDGTGAALDLTGYSVAAQIWSAGKASKIADMSVAWIDRTAGKFTLSISAETTDTIGEGGIWDLLITNPDGTKDYWLRGQAVLDLGYTS